MKLKNGEGNLWMGLRWIFWLFIGAWILSSVFIESNAFLSIGLIGTLLSISTFVLSIVHLTKYKAKDFAITALVFSSYWILSVVVGFLVMVVQQ